MLWLDIVISIIFIFVFIGGIRQGAIRSISSVLSLIIAIPLTGLSFHFLAGVFSFIHDEVWANFLGFAITFIAISIILSVVFWIPRKLMNLAWQGVLGAIIGGIFALVGFGISLVLFRILIETYPIWDWLVRALQDSEVIGFLLTIFGFVRFMLPEAFRITSTVLQYLI